MRSKYDGLGVFLAGQYADEIPMSFAEVEEVVGSPLPPSARTHRPWWSNNAENSAMTRVWLRAGFRSAQVDLAGERLVFVRTKVNAMKAQQGGFDESHSALVAKPGTPARHPAIGALKGVITIAPGDDLTDAADPAWVDRLHEERAAAGDLVGGLDDPVPEPR